MTTDDLPADADPNLVRQIVEARRAQETAREQLGQVREQRRELEPLWARLGLGTVPDTFGVELEAVSMQPRGRRR